MSRVRLGQRISTVQNYLKCEPIHLRNYFNLCDSLVSGNEKLSLLTMNRKYKLRIELEDFTGEKRYAEYSVFSVKPATDKYRLAVGGYSGNAGIQS